MHITFAQTLLFHIFVRYMTTFDTYTRLEIVLCAVKILRLRQAGTRTFRTNLNGNDHKVDMYYNGSCGIVFSNFVIVAFW